jgi:O-acetylhomoserine (thiol)-lyase
VPDDQPTPELDYASLAVHAGIPRVPGGPVGLPVNPNVAWEFEDLEHAAEVFATGEGLSYSRIQNPTVAALEARLTALENAGGAVVTASGQAATLLALISLARSGDHLVAASSLFGGTVGLLGQVLPGFGIKASLVDNDSEAIRAALRPETRAILVETIGNPALDVPDFAAVSAVTRAARVPLVVDNTWGAAGYLCRPLEHGAQVVVHSLTKWAAGHGSVLGGAVLAGGDFDLTGNPAFSEAGRDGRSLLESHPDGASAFLWRARNLGLQQMGLTLAPQSAWMIAQGLETLPVRVERQCATALALARALVDTPGVAWSSYPGLERHPHHSNATRYLQRGAGAVLTFGVEGGLEGAANFMRRLGLVRRAANLGDTRTLAVHPWTTTHGRLPEAGRRAAGVSPETIRLSVGLEDPRDLLADLRQALAP